MKKQEKMTSREAHHSTKMMGVMVMFIFFMFFFIGITSAEVFTIDNKLTYSNEDLKVDFDNLFGLGKHYGSVELKSHPSVNYVKEVGAGNRVVMWYDFSFEELYKNGLGEVIFTDQRTGEKIDRNYSFVYWGDIGVDKYGRGECSFNVNGTENCERVITGTRTYQDWIPYDSKDIPKGNIRIGIKVNVEINDYVDGVWEIAGKKVKKHSEWTASLNVDLQNYWTLNGTTGVVLDSLFSINGTNFGAERGVTGIINDSFDFDGDVDDSVNFTTPNSEMTINNSLTVSFWIDLDDNVSRQNIISHATEGSSNWAIGTEGGEVISIFGDGAVAIRDGGAVASLGTGFHNVVVVYRDVGGEIGGADVFVDNVNRSGFGGFGPANSGTPNFHFGTLDGTGRDYDGRLDEVAFWNRTLSVAEIDQLWNGGAGITVKTQFGPTVTLNSPVDTFNTTNQTINFNGTVTSGTLINVSLFIDGILNETNSSGIEGDYLFTKIISNGNHNWTYEAFDGEGSTTGGTRTFTISNFVENSQTFNDSSFETATEKFTINITSNGTTPTNGKLIYNGTTFSSAIITSVGGMDFNITRTIDIPTVSGNKSWFFNFIIGGEEFNSSTQTQLINLTNYTFCESGFSPVYINFTFKNETVAEETVSAEIDVDWNLWLGEGDTFKTLSFTNTTENFDYGFCLTDPSDRTLNTNVSLTYDNSISQQRSFSRAFTLTNATTNQTLFLLPTEDGLFITFQTVTVAEQVISDVAVNVTKLLDLISTGFTDDAGLIQFFLDPDTTYTFTFSKEGFDTVTTSLKPTQTSFTITMGAEVIQIENDTTRGITYTINPLANVLSNNTETEFNLTFGSSLFILDNFGFALKNSTGDIFNATSSTTDTGGFLSRQLNTGNNSDIIMEIFWTISGNQTNITRTWLVLDTSDEGFSIKTFFDDLSIYLTSGMFGLTDFGLGIIIFGIILLVTGILAARFGNIITNPPGISLIIFSLVLFFDVGLGIMPNPINAVPNFPTIFVGLIFLGTLLKEGIK